MWKEKVVKNRRVARDQGKQFYNGMVIFDRKLQNELMTSRELRGEYAAAADWMLPKKEQVMEIRKEYQEDFARQQQAKEQNNESL